ncbi:MULTISPECIES: DUF4878 domain-containing protein [unclassified Gilliamella]|jgi:hypothetical protein|uniref:DUF4878 domain-containing protein n=1 Tax=unclassified Gilliamella TaxID=2685620 RepID=UPI00080E608B|nr:DUF4878 domain-containing protein [Gilliamella apicola]OCG39858.1 hypothetical protein A9G25_10765 [Gilliamella apicola]OCG70893.1 hypothetical protein A9G43_06520 [Gilliamella apicola]
MKLVIKFLSIFLLALMVTACSNDDSPEKVSEKFITAIYKGDTDTVMSLINFPKDSDNTDMDMRMFVKSKMQEALVRGKKFTDDHGGLDKVESAPAEYTNDEKTMAKVKTTVFFKDNTKKEEKNISVIKADGKWLINLK